MYRACTESDNIIVFVNDKVMKSLLILTAVNTLVIQQNNCIAVIKTKHNKSTFQKVNKIINKVIILRV